MTKGKILFLVFILLAIAQIIVPAKMVFDSESTLSSGKEYRFRTAPVDPLDYFRGKYVSLSFREVTWETRDSVSMEYGDEVFVVLGTDGSGYAVIRDIVMEEPEAVDYVRATIVSKDPAFNYYKVTIEYPFNRFYMDEFKALDAELAYREATTVSDAYAVVRVKDGNAVIDDVILDGKTIKEAAEEYGRKK